MKKSTKRTALVIASLMSVNSVAMANSFPPSASDRLSQISKDDKIMEIVARATEIKKADLIATRDRIFNIIDTLNAIKNDNETDPVLRYANAIQTGLALATAASLAAHLNNTEQRRFMLTVSAASALVTSATRFYKSRASLTPKDVSQTLRDFTNELMAKKEDLTPEERELIKEVAAMSSRVLDSQSTIEKLVGTAGDASYITTMMVVGLAITHWISPKIAKEAEEGLKLASTAIAESVRRTGKFANESKITVGATGGASVLPDVIGNAMGLSTESSQKLLNQTIDSLTIATLNFQTQIDKVNSASSGK